MSYNDWMNFRARFKSLILTKGWKNTLTKQQRDKAIAFGKAYNLRLQKQNLQTLADHLAIIEAAHEELGWLESEAQSLLTKLSYETDPDSITTITQNLNTISNNIQTLSDRLKFPTPH